MRFSTKAIHAGVEPDPSFGSIMTPIHLTSTFVQEEIGKHKGYVYSRVGNPTRTALEKNIAVLEDGKEGFAFASGLSAIDAVFRLLHSGDHILLSRNLYGGTYRLSTQILANYDLHFEFVDTTHVPIIERAIKFSTKMVFIETPTNPTMEIADLAAIGKLCRAKNLLLAVDNTFATPYYQNPIQYGADIVVHSATKYLNGHSDLLGGLVVATDEKIIERLRFIQKAVGAVLSPFDSWLCLRGIKTLAVRMEQHNCNAIAVASFLENHPKVRKVYFPGLASHPQHELARQQMRGWGGMISFDLGYFKAANTFLKNLKLCVLAESLGGVETLIAHPATMTHSSVPKDERERAGITEGLLRISVGIEDKNDILDDIKQALEFV
jgi:cystathionine beta-lyase/cystathionine gamma-synthase